jgi:hypothetical protein
MNHTWKKFRSTTLSIVITVIVSLVKFPSLMLLYFMILSSCNVTPICPNGPSPSLLASSLPAFNFTPASRDCFPCRSFLEKGFASDGALDNVIQVDGTIRLRPQLVQPSNQPGSS